MRRQTFIIRNTLSLIHILPNDVYQNLMAFDVVCTTEAYSQVYNLPMTSGRWLEPSSEGGSLEAVSYTHLKDYDTHKAYPDELLDEHKRYVVGAGVNTRDYAERIPALVEAGADAVSYTHLDVYKRQM